MTFSDTAVIVEFFFFAFLLFFSPFFLLRSSQFKKADIAIHSVLVIATSAVYICGQNEGIYSHFVPEYPRGIYWEPLIVLDILVTAGADYWLR